MHEHNNLTSKHHNNMNEPYMMNEHNNLTSKHHNIINEHNN